jgi:anaerobic selenocysteine-containing dehydrogenase
LRRPRQQADRYPLVLTCAKSTLFCQTQHRALPSLRRRAIDPEVMLHPKTETRRSIAAGDWVSIETPTSAMRAKALLNDNIDQRVVVGEHGWWQAAPEANAPGYDPFSPQGSNYNLIVIRPHRAECPLRGREPSNLMRGGNFCFGSIPAV